MYVFPLFSFFKFVFERNTSIKNEILAILTIEYFFYRWLYIFALHTIIWILHATPTSKTILPCLSKKYRKKRILFILLDCMIMCIQTLFCIFWSLNGFRLVQSDLLEMSHKMGIVKQGVVSCWAKFYVYSVLAIEISLINLSTCTFNTYLK